MSLSTPHVVALGELLLRLKAPGYERLMQSGHLEATFGGAEANVAAALANDGIDVAVVTALPTNALGDAAIGELRRFGIHTQHVVQQEGRIGTYYLEAGAGQRPGRVIYDRADSVLSLISPTAFKWRDIFANATWLHVSGITPALSESAAQITLEAVTVARELGLTVSCDYNFRGNLWRYGKQPADVMRAIVNQVHIGISGRGDCQTMLGIVPEAPEPEGGVDTTWYQRLTDDVLAQFPNLHMQVITLREGSSASNYRWSACLQSRQEFLVSQAYEVTEVVDRVGAGDAFSAGLLYGLLNDRGARYALEYATAASCLKHTIPGDVNRVSVNEVEALMRGQGGGRMQR
ncbi:MAG: sugar kinase [Gemmatimonas sp.]